MKGPIMNKKIISAFLVSLLICLQLPAQELPGVPVFGDDFNVIGLFVENWESTKDTKTEGGRAIIPSNNNMKLRRIPEGNFGFTADLTVEKPEGEIGHCGVVLDGIHFMINPSTNPSAGTAYRVPGEKRSRGNNSGAIPGFKFGEPCRVFISREKLGEGYKYSYKVNGQTVDSFQIIMPADGKITFYGYRTNMEVDNFQLYSLKKGDGSKNLAVNSSFEYLQEGMPNYMRPFLGGKYKFDDKWEDFLENFAIDTNEKVSGDQSIRMTCGKDYPASNGVGTYNVNVMAKNPVTFSVYLKASEDNFPVTLHIWELHHKNHSKSITISKEWERYAFTVDNPERATVRGSVRFNKPGVVWADDIQVEIGTNATKYLPSSLDKDKFNTEKKEKPLIEKDIILTKSKKAPVIDGNIEDLWFEDAVKVDKFFFNGGKTPINKTEAYLTCDSDNLYIAVRAYVPDTSKVKAEEFSRDNLKVHSGDCIEVFLDTTFGREEYYHLTANAVGSKTDMGPGRILSWNGDWDVSTKINEKSNSIDYEMRFPLKLFAGIDLSRRWGLNIGRNDTDSNEVYSLTHVKTPNFHVPQIYPAIVFPDGIVEKFKVGLRELYLIGKDSQIYVGGTVGNVSGQILNSEIQIIDKTTENVIGKKNIKISEGNTEILIPINAAADLNMLDSTVKIVVDGKDFLSSSQRINLARELDIYTRYNYYMNEEFAVLVGTLGLPKADELTGKVTVAGRTFDVKMEKEFAIEIPIKELANGKHLITLDVYKEDEKLVRGTSELVKREFQKGATQIDRQRRCLVVDGEPYLVIAPFFGVNRGITIEEQDVVLKNMLRLHKEMGYKCFLVGAVDENLVPEQTQKFIDLCDKEGIKVIYWPFQSWKHREKMNPKERLESIKGDNIIACMVIDEPELYAKSDEVEEFLEAHRKISPYTPIFMNNTRIGIPGHFAGLKTDILMIDDYLTNREGRKVIEMIDAATMVWEAGKEERQPAFYFLTGENLHNHYRELTYAEQIAQTYGVVIAGTRGVSYFCSMPLYPEDYRASVDVNRELLELEDVILSIEKTSEAAITDSVVKFMTKKLGDKVYIIALNSDNDRMVDVEITLPAEFKYANKAEVKFENRNIKVTNGVISDNFKALERHVYVIDIDQ